MPVAVTGASGRLGCALVRALLERGHQVRVLELGEGRPASLAGLAVEIVHGSVLDTDAVATLIDGAEVVYHLAAKVDLDRDHDGSVHAVNVEGTRNVAEYCLANGIRMVHCSSHHALQLAPLDQPLDEAKPLDLDHVCDYHRSKAFGEKLVHELVRDRGLDAVVINPGTLTGPYDYEPSMLGKSLIDLYRGRLPALLAVTTDCADARDVADAAIAAALHGRCGERYLLTGPIVPMREMAEIWGAVTGVAMPRVMLPLWVGWLATPFTVAAARLAGRKALFTPNMLRASVSNAVVRYDKAADELGFAPRPLADSLADAFTFFGEHDYLDAS